MATRQAYGTALSKLAQNNSRVIALDGDTKNSTFSNAMLKTDPKRWDKRKLLFCTWYNNFIGFLCSFCSCHLSDNCVDTLWCRSSWVKQFITNLTRLPLQVHWMFHCWAELGGCGYRCCLPRPYCSLCIYLCDFLHPRLWPASHGSRFSGELFCHASLMLTNEESCEVGSGDCSNMCSKIYS